MRNLLKVLSLSALLILTCAVNVEKKATLTGAPTVAVATSSSNTVANSVANNGGTAVTQANSATIADSQAEKGSTATTTAVSNTGANADASNGGQAAATT